MPKNESEALQIVFIRFTGLENPDGAEGVFGIYADRRVSYWRVSNPLC